MFGKCLQKGILWMAIFFFPWLSACRILDPAPGIEPGLPAVEASTGSQWVGNVLISLSDSIPRVRNYFIADNTVKGWDIAPIPDKKGSLQVFWGAPSMHAYLVHRLLLKRGACKFKRKKSFDSMIHFFPSWYGVLCEKVSKKKKILHTYSMTLRE